MLVKFLMGLLIFILFFKALGLLARWWLQRKLSRFMQQQKEHFEDVQQHTRDHQAQEQDMVRCATCQLFLPRARAQSKGNQYFCSTQHVEDFFANQR